jgi:Flp pilus assembly pilin Flp
MRNTLQSNKKDLGQGLVEYILLLILVSLVAVAATKSLGNTIRDKIKTAKKHVLSDITFEN